MNLAAPPVPTTPNTITPTTSVGTALHQATHGITSTSIITVVAVVLGIILFIKVAHLLLRVALIIAVCVVAYIGYHSYTTAHPGTQLPSAPTVPTPLTAPPTT